MNLQSFEELGEYVSLVPEFAGRAVIFDKDITALGLNGTRVEGILCGSNINKDGINAVRWCKCPNRVVVIKGLVQIEIDDEAVYGEAPYVDSLGKFYAKAGVGRVQASNVLWESNGNTPLIRVGVGAQLPKPNFEMPLISDLSFIVRS